MSESRPSGYEYHDTSAGQNATLLWPTVFRLLDGLRPAERRVFDLGCGNGALVAALAARGWDAAGADPSADGIRLANAEHPGLRLRVGSAYDDLAAEFGRFPVVVSLEVVEHVFYPRKYARCLFDLLEPGGTALVSTPYHGYLKNLAVAAAGRWDHHHSPLWDYGHIKFWSRATLTALLAEAGLTVVDFHRVGRLPPLAKSMIAVARKPAAG